MAGGFTGGVAARGGSGGSGDRPGVWAWNRYGLGTVTGCVPSGQCVVPVRFLTSSGNGDTLPSGHRRGRMGLGGRLSPFCSAEPTAGRTGGLAPASGGGVRAHICSSWLGPRGGEGRNTGGVGVCCPAPRAPGLRRLGEEFPWEAAEQAVRVEGDLPAAPASAIHQPE